MLLFYSFRGQYAVMNSRRPGLWRFGLAPVRYVPREESMALIEIGARRPPGGRM
jgi:hypothetical protein